MKNEWVGHVVNTAVTAFVTLLGAWFVLVGNLDSGKNDAMASFLDRIHDLEIQVDNLRVTIAQLSVENIELQTQLVADKGGEATLRRFMDDVPVPMWIKEVEEKPGQLEPDFRMLILNREYEDALDVSRYLYEGRTDFEIHPLDVALQFRQNDMETWQTRSTAIRLERFSMGGKMVTRLVVKFLVHLPGSRWGVAGFVAPPWQQSEDCPAPISWRMDMMHEANYKRLLALR